MDTQRITNLLSLLKRIGSQNNWNLIPIPVGQITSIKNDLSKISYDIAIEYPHFSSELFRLKDMLFIYNGCLNSSVFGQIIAILKSLNYDIDNQKKDIWSMIHSRIIKSSKQLYLDGHYANAAEDAFIEINDRVKNLYTIVKPGDSNVPDGYDAMNKVFSDNPLIEICDRSTETGKNIHNGTRFMLAGAMSALRNPKAHTNTIVVTKEECMRRLMFASMLMYKIDEAVNYSGIIE
ncbi:TIGR02391 family protein [Ruminococcus albus]|uniref:Conserved hypothetical protein CHP02391 domain-containing protein n=1 Tax=Ruminococcus albus (strain ATCC 27210 / DSM 20455 / JCM 14654 / NCDO 2250 / 7) TaxID=697329 RepID=E6UEZ1_RUMA7|nr:TIGR02391 family protein [Ruminococcus albus]ADU22990.1 Conserved hypothetical protein CHP02391 [Ruminococcus albus 7 = DSM 20455]